MLLSLHPWGDELGQEIQMGDRGERCSPKEAMAAVETLFVDIGGVLLTNGWDRGSRQRAAQVFDLDYAEVDERHHLTFDTYEEGKLTLDEYLDRVIFYEPRKFSHKDFRDFMYAQSQ